MPAVSVSVPGKIILCGEHAVVYGYGAIALPVRQVHMRVMISADPLAPAGRVTLLARDIGAEGTLEDLPVVAPLRVALERLRDELGLDHFPAMQVRLSGDIPTSGGMGASAAVAVGLVRAVTRFLGIAVAQERLLGLAQALEDVFHGNASGIDPSTIVLEAPIFFTRADGPQPLRVRASFALVIADSGERRETRRTIDSIREEWDASGERVHSRFERIGQISAELRSLLEGGGSLERIGGLLNENHGLLRELGLSTALLERLVQVALGAGALGAKLSGGGMGGCMFALTTQENAERVAAELEGGGALRTIVAPYGEGDEGARLP